MGVNGYIWVSVSVGERDNTAVEGFVDAEGVYSDVNDVSRARAQNLQDSLLMHSALLRSGHFSRFSTSDIAGCKPDPSVRTLLDPSERYSPLGCLCLVPG
jgi:hypothetical protein